MTFSKKKRIIIVCLIIGLLVFGFLLFRNRNNQQETILVKTGDFVNQVSISGKVIPAENVELAFKNSGRIERIYFSVDEFARGEKTIKAGNLIAEIDTTDAKKNIHDAEISLENAKLSLAKLKIENSKDNLNADLQKAYDNGFVEVSDTFLDLTPAINGLEDVLEQENISDNSVRISGKTAQSYKTEAEKLYYKTKDVFEKTRINFRMISRNSSKEDIEKIINETYETTKVLIDAIKSTKNLLDYMAEDTNRASDFVSSQNTLYEYTNTINGHFSNLLAIKNSIKSYQDTFSSTDLDIQSLLLAIKQKENFLEDAKNKLQDYYIRAPFNGIITRIDAKVGEIASPNVSLVAMMGIGTFQVESYVPEINISKIKLGNEAQITLDAYGEETIFLAKVVSIDPAETIRNGVSTYKIKLQFNEKDNRIKSGMTANVKVNVFNKPNVIVIPQGVIFEKGNQKFVQIKKEQEISEQEITTGNVSTLGQVEVVSGLSDGDVVILNPVLK